MQDFARVLRTGQPANWGGAKGGQDWHVAMQDEAFARRFTAAMDCRGLYLGEALARAVDLSQPPPRARHRRRIGHLRLRARRTPSAPARHGARPGAGRANRHHADRRARPCRPHRRRRRRFLQRAAAGWPRRASVLERPARLGRARGASPARRPRSRASRQVDSSSSTMPSSTPTRPGRSRWPSTRCC